jgi:hypothetical protein
MLFQFNISQNWTLGNFLLFDFKIVHNRIGGIMVSVLTSSAVDHGFDLQSGQTKDY